MNLEAFDITDGSQLVERVRQSLNSTEPAERDAAVESLVEALARSSNGPRIVALLSGAPEPWLRLLTIQVVVRIQPRLESALFLVVRHLLLDKEMPESPLLDLAAFLLKETIADLKQAPPILRSLVSGLNHAQTLERLQRLEQRMGKLPALDQFRERLKDKSLVPCPQCQACLPRPELIKHLWLEHQLVWDGHSVREPWHLLEDWVEQYYEAHNPQLLAQARMLARQIDPEKGEQRLKQLFLTYQKEDAETTRALVEEAKKQGATVCPHCYALVYPPPEGEPVRPLNVSHGRISGAGFRIEVSDSGLHTRLEVETPEGHLHQGGEPGQFLTSKGALVYFAGPWVVLALFVALLGSLWEWAILPPVLILLAFGMIFAVVAQLAWRMPRAPSDRSVDYAWTLLVPTLLKPPYTKGADFLAGLCQISVGRGKTGVRSKSLDGLLTIMERAVSSGERSAAHLGAVWRLAIDDASRVGSDPIPLLLSQIERCFEGQVSLVMVEQLLSGWADHGWPEGEQARLRVLICDRAFELGHEVRDLITMGHAAPSLGAVLRTDQPQELAALRLLWSLRPTIPWARIGEAATAFELAEHQEAGIKHLGRHPDLLLVAWEVSGAYLCARGMVYNKICFTAPPTSIEVRPRSPMQGGGFDFLIGGHTFWFSSDPSAVVAPLERWFRYYFQDFRPLIADAYGWRSPQHPAALDVRMHLRCPECKQSLTARIGELGMKDLGSRSGE